MAECPSEEQLRDLALDTLGGDEASTLLSHVESCAACQQSLTEWRKNLPFMAVLRRTYASNAPAGNPRTGPPAESIEGYEILGEIRRGAQGIVYRATDRSNGAAVAIKIVGCGPYVSEIGRRRFEREIELAASLHHPGVIRVHRSGITPSGRPYFVMDHVEGLPLHRYVWEKGLSLEETLALFIRVCDAVNYAHQRGVIHCDLKPSNILVANDGSPRILDFGLARCTYPTGDASLSVTGQLMGTLPYMSPEQTLANRAEVDIRTDVYALGVVLFEVLTGRYPYPVTGSVPEVLRHINETTPALPSKAWTTDSGIGIKPATRHFRLRRPSECPIDEQVDTILLKALAKLPQRRYPNVAMFMEDLSRHLHGQPIEARREVWIHAFRKQLARYKTAVVVAMVCALLTAGSAIKYWHVSQALKSQQATMITYQSRLATALMMLGDQAMTQKDLEESSGCYRAAMFIIRDLVAGDTRNLDYAELQADVYLRLGNLFKARGEMGEAVDYFSKALEIASQLVAVDPGRPMNHSRLSQVQGLYNEAKLSTTKAAHGAPSPTPASTSGRRP
jgi:hypothetical protein